MKNTKNIKEHENIVNESATIKGNNEEDEMKDMQAELLETNEVKELKLKLEQKTKEAEEYVGLLQRNLAEFDNFKKRTVKEKDSLYSNAITDIMTNILPIIDSLEKALESTADEQQGKIFEGVQMILKQFKEILKNLGVSEIEAVGHNFNPELHEAVMHIQDESFGENEIIEVFRKGYICGDKVVRHSMVKVAN
jgi:molecular chaperone GrpE